MHVMRFFLFPLLILFASLLLGRVGFAFSIAWLNIAIIGGATLLLIGYGLVRLYNHAPPLVFVAVLLITCLLMLPLTMISIFVVGEFLQKPEESVSFSGGLICEVTGWGGAWGDSGYNVTLYRASSLMPILRRAVASGSVNESAGSPPIDCHQLLAQWQANRK